MEFFSREAGQARRNALADSLEGLAYFVPPELRPWLGIANELNPVVSMERAGVNALAAADPNATGWERVQAVGDMASNMAGSVAPMVAASRGAAPAAQAVEDALMGWSASSPMAYAARDFAADEFGGVRLMGGGMSDPTQTGWTFRDVDNNIGLSRAENKMLSEGALKPTQEVVPIRSLYAMQARVNPDFAVTTSSEGSLPNVIRKNGRLFLQDGHHRATRVAEEGSQNLRVNFYDFDRVDRSAPLLEYDAQRAAKQKAEDEYLLKMLFGD